MEGWEGSCKHRNTCYPSALAFQTPPSEIVSKTLNERGLLERVLSRIVISREISNPHSCMVEATAQSRGRVRHGRVSLGVHSRSVRSLADWLTVALPTPGIVPFTLRVLSRYQMEKY